jgi:hypothetical protein
MNDYERFLHLQQLAKSGLREATDFLAGVHEIDDRESLWYQILLLETYYQDPGFYLADELLPDTLDQMPARVERLDRAISEFIDLLHYEPEGGNCGWLNYGILARKLAGSDDTAAVHTELAKLDRLEAKLDELRPYLARIRRVTVALTEPGSRVRLRKRTKPRGKRGARGDATLHAIVARLADYWQGKLGRGPFRAKAGRVWVKEKFTHKGQRIEHTNPIPPAAKFVHDVVALIDPSKMSKLPSMMERVRRERQQDVEAPERDGTGSGPFLGGAGSLIWPPVT